MTNQTALRRARWRARWDAFRFPINEEKRELLRARWNSLPNELKTPNQIAGRHLTHCGFITGASYCSFRCTHCYLPKNANEIPIPSLAEMKETIDANRHFQGPGGGLQITGGDVADAYWRAGKQDELIEIVRYSNQVGLVPMVMTHGQTLLEHPEFLEALVTKGGLRQVAVHIDMTQAGRHGFPINRLTSEGDLHPLRAAFTTLATKIRARTGLSLELAHNCTVTERNLDSIAEIVRWFLADPARSRIWRILSFQPEANTGRTIFSKNPVTPERTWEKLCQGMGLEIDPNGFLGGHPACNHGTTLLVEEIRGRYLPLVPNDSKTVGLISDLLERLGAISTLTTDGESGSSLLPYRVMGAFASHPSLAWRSLARLLVLACSGQVPAHFLGAIATNRVHTLNIGTHNFMDASEVAAAPENPLVKARLEACVFKGAVRDRITGEWEAVPMCSMNESRWSALYAERMKSVEGLKGEISA